MDPGLTAPRDSRAMKDLLGARGGSVDRQGGGRDLVRGKGVKHMDDTRQKLRGFLCLDAAC